MRKELKVTKNHIGKEYGKENANEQKGQETKTKKVNSSEINTRDAMIKEQEI